ncbi:MAG: hypothetical protein AABZ32_00685 [Bacteroidota bacterium]
MTDPYIPPTDSAKVIWLNNFSAKIGGYASLFGISPEEITSVEQDAAAFSYWVGQVQLFITEKEERVAYKNLLRDGPIGSAGGTAPSVPGCPAADEMLFEDGEVMEFEDAEEMEYE